MWDRELWHKVVVVGHIRFSAGRNYLSVRKKKSTPLCTLYSCCNRVHVVVRNDTSKSQEKRMGPLEFGYLLTL